MESLSDLAIKIGKINRFEDVKGRYDASGDDVKAKSLGESKTPTAKSLGESKTPTVSKILDSTKKTYDDGVSSGELSQPVKLDNAISHGTVTKPKRVQHYSKLMDSFSVAINNKFGVLADVSMDVDEIPMQPEPQPSTSGVSENLKEQAPENLQPQKRQKPPPICFILRVGKSYQEFCAKLDAISREYYIQFASDKTFGSSRFILTRLKRKTHAYIMKGLSEDAEPEDIKQELLELDIKNGKKQHFPPLPPKEARVASSHRTQSQPEESQQTDRESCISEDSDDSNEYDPSSRRSSSSRRGMSRGVRDARLRGRDSLSFSQPQQGLSSNRRSNPWVSFAGTENKDQSDLNEIVTTMNEINAIVDLKKLSLNLKKLLQVIKKCSTPFEYAMAIHDFNMNHNAP
ncbi:hypothetical protein QE152_g26269 [Popillia japonica]|uniref:Uncharacterized protein n=1 Tax=Popillia japonica TaxID=7064 RepID=A0AAW1JZ73_POPJA